MKIESSIARSHLLLLSLILSFAIAPRASAQFQFANPGIIAINDNSAATPYPSQINVSGVVGTLANLRVSLSAFTHRFPDDVDVLLVSPSGEKAVIMSDAGGGGSTTNINLVLSDAAAPVLPDSGTLFSGTYRPANYSGAEGSDVFPAGAPSGPYASTLAAFNGIRPTGTWSLYVFDDGPGDQGLMTNGWSLIFDTAPLISQIPDLVGNEDTIITTDFTLSSDYNDLNTITLSAVSSGPMTLGASFFGSGANRSIALTPGNDQLGTNTVTVTATSPLGLQASRTFQVRVLPVNDAPSISGLLASLSVPLKGAAQLPISLSDPDSPTSALQVTAFSSDSSLVIARVTGTGASRTLHIVPMSLSTGLVTVTIQVSDGGATANASLPVTVEPTAALAFSNFTPIRINDGTTATPYPSQIHISNISGSITNVRVTLLGMSHTFTDDVDVLLTGPNGANVMLMSDAGGHTDLDQHRITFDDSATLNVPENSEIEFNQVYRPTDYEAGELLPGLSGGLSSGLGAAFNGISPNGTWSLRLADDVLTDVGSLGAWIIWIETDSPSQPGPVILQQPVSDVYVLPGDDVALFVEALGSGLEYRWMRNGADLESFGPFYSFTVQPGDIGSVYTVEVTTAAGVPIVSSGANIRALAAPTIQSHPQNQIGSPPGAAFFSVSAASDGDLSYQWFRNAIPISGETGHNLYMPYSLLNLGSYTVRVSNRAGTVFSQAAQLSMDGMRDIPIQNPSFEQPVYDDGAWSQAPTDWVVTGYAGNWNPSGGVLDPIPDGSQVGFFDVDRSSSGGTMTQVLSTRLEPNTAYLLEAYVDDPNSVATMRLLTEENVVLAESQQVGPGGWIRAQAYFETTSVALNSLLKVELSSTAPANFDNPSLRSAPIACEEPPTGMVAWWTFDNNLRDYAGTNNGTGVGFYYDYGRVANGIYLNGVNAFVEVPDSPALNPPNAMTVEAWVKPDSFFGNGNNPIVVKPVSSHVPPHYQYNLFLQGDYASRRFGFSVAAGGQSFEALTPASAWNPGEWYHIAGTYDGAIVTLYVNGQPVASTPASGTIPNYGQPLRIGNNSDAAPAGSHLPGIVDEVAIYDRALSPQQIVRMYHAASFGKCIPPPTIEVPPVDVTVLEGEPATLSVTAGPGIHDFYWYKDGVYLHEFTTIGGTTSAVTISSAQAGNAGSYFVSVINRRGGLNSPTANLNVIVNETLWFVTHPQNYTAVAGGRARFVAEAAGPIWGYQWTRNGVAIDGANGPTLELLNVTPGIDDGDYRLVVTDGEISITSQPAALAILPFSPQVSHDFDAALGSGVSLSGNAQRIATGGFADSGFVRLTDNLTSQFGALVVEDFNSGAPVYGFIASFDLLMGGGSTPPAEGFEFQWGMLKVEFDTHDGGGEAAPAIDVSFGNSLVASHPLSISEILTEWDGVPRFEPVIIFLRNTGHLDVYFKGRPILSQIALADFMPTSGAEFGATARTSALSAQHAIDNLSLQTFSTRPPLEIAHQPASATTYVGFSVAFSTDANLAGATYQWFKNGSALPGATGKFYKVADAQLNDAGTYRVDVSVPQGPTTVQSSNVTLTVLPPGRYFVIEAEDFNFGSGLHLPAASAMPLGSLLYAGQSAVSNVDYHNTLVEPSGDTYRVGESPNVPMALGDDDLNRGAYDISSNYRLGWNGDGEWFNYTRSFPAGNYVVYAAVAQGYESPTAGGQLALIEDATTSAQTPIPIGTFSGPASLFWQVNHLFPLRNGSGDVAVLSLDGLTTLRYTTSTGDPDYLLFVDASPRIMQQPASVAYQPGVAAVFSVAAIAEPAAGSLSYQWRKNGADMPGETFTTLSITEPQPGDTFLVVVSNSAGSVTSQPAEVVPADRLRLEDEALMHQGLVAQRNDSNAGLDQLSEVINRDFYTAEQWVAFYTRYYSTNLLYEGNRYGQYFLAGHVNGWASRANALKQNIAYYRVATNKLSALYAAHSMDLGSFVNSLPEAHWKDVIWWHHMLHQIGQVNHPDFDVRGNIVGWLQNFSALHPQWLAWNRHIEVGQRPAATHMRWQVQMALRDTLRKLGDPNLSIANALGMSPEERALLVDHNLFIVHNSFFNSHDLEVFHSLMSVIPAHFPSFEVAAVLPELNVPAGHPLNNAIPVQVEGWWAIVENRHIGDLRETYLAPGDPPVASSDYMAGYWLTLMSDAFNHWYRHEGNFLPTQTNLLTKAGSDPLNYLAPRRIRDNPNAYSEWSDGFLWDIERACLANTREAFELAKNRLNQMGRSQPMAQFLMWLDYWSNRGSSARGALISERGDFGSYPLPLTRDNQQRIQTIEFQSGQLWRVNYDLNGDPASVVPVETVPPTVVSVGGKSDGTKFWVRFSEEVNKNSAEALGAYAVVSSTVSGAMLLGDGKTVELTLASAVTGAAQITIKDVSDLAGNIMASAVQLSASTLWSSTDLEPGSTMSPPSHSAALSDNSVLIEAGGAVLDYDLHYVFRPISGDFDARVQISEFASSSHWGAAGLVFLNDLEQGRPRASTWAFTPGGENRFFGHFRYPNSVDYLWGPVPTIDLRWRGPVQPGSWLRLIRSGSKVYSLASDNGSDWHLLFETEHPFANDGFIGLAASAHNDGRAETVRVLFENFSVTTAQPVVQLHAFASSLREEQGAQLKLYASISQTLPFNIIVPLQAGGTAQSGFDYDGLPGSIIIPAGQRFGTALLPVLDDAIAEGAETVTLSLSGGASHEVVGDPLTITIIDNESPLGALTRSVYWIPNGQFISNLHGNPKFPDQPDVVDFLTSFETIPLPYTHGTHLSGYLHPPETGHYRFFVSSADNAELYLSPSSSPDGKVLIAHEPNYSGSREFNPRNNEANISAPIFLQAGQKYYVEFLRVRGGWDLGSVAWQKPSDLGAPANGSEPIPGAYLEARLEDVPNTTVVWTPWTPSRNGNGHYFGLASGNLRSWGAAEVFASTIPGAHLASFHNDDENWFGYESFAPGPNWIGLTDYLDEGNFRWTTGESLSLTLWHPGEPNNANGSESFGHLHYGRHDWNDLPDIGYPNTGIFEVSGAILEHPGLPEVLPGSVRIDTFPDNIQPAIGDPVALQPSIVFANPERETGSESAVWMNDITVSTSTELSSLGRTADRLIDGTFDGDGNATSLGASWESSGIGFAGTLTDDRNPSITVSLGGPAYVSKLRFWNFPELPVAVRRIAIEVSSGGDWFHFVNEATLAPTGMTEVELLLPRATHLRFWILENHGGDEFPLEPGVPISGFHGFAGLQELRVFGSRSVPTFGPRFQWSFNETIMPGATSSTLDLGAFTREEAGRYHLRIQAGGTVIESPYIDIAMPSAHEDFFASVSGEAFVIEAEDYNYASGQHVPGASVMPLQSGLYAGASAATLGVDYWTIDDINQADDYRFNDEPNVPIVPAPNLNRGTFSLNSNHRVGWLNHGEWYNYTRTFPASGYRVYAALSSADRDLEGTLSRIANPQVPGQTAEHLGFFRADSTGGWGVNDFVPLTDTSGNPVTISLSETETLRYTAESNADIDYFVLIDQKPFILGQPQHLSVPPGQNATFSISADRGAAYQWYRNGVPIDGANSPTYTAVEAETSAAGIYHVRVSNDFGFVDSQPAVLWVGDWERGSIKREVYSNIVGFAVSDLREAGKFPASPDLVTFPTSFEVPANIGTNYGTKLSGYILAPETGNYRFYLAADDQAVLWLSTNEYSTNLVQIAHEPLWNFQRAWTTNFQRPEMENTSEPVFLTAGRAYRFLVLHKEAQGGDHAAVAWQRPGAPVPVDGAPPIPGEFLARPLDEGLGAPIVVLQPQAGPRYIGDGIKISVFAEGAAPLSYQWMKDGLDLPNETNRVLSIPVISFGDHGEYQVRISNSIGETLSASALLDVGSVPEASELLWNPVTGNYYFLLEQSSWFAAEATARLFGGHLASIHSASEQLWVSTNFLSLVPADRNLWIGLFDDNRSVNSSNPSIRASEFSWSSGEPMTYSNWSSGEPGDSSGTELAGEIWRAPSAGGAIGWNDRDPALAGPQGVVEIPGTRHFDIELGARIAQDYPEPYAGNVARPFERQVYRFHGNPGDAILIDDFGGGMELTLLDPDGNLLAVHILDYGPSISQVLEKSGTYVIEVAAPTLDPEITGAYSFQIRVAPEALEFSYTSPFGFNVQDNGLADIYPSTINVSGLPGWISRITVQLDGLWHSPSDDLDILLQGPGGEKVMLLSDAATEGGIVNGVITFDQSGGVHIPGGDIWSGVYAPSNQEGSSTDVFPAPAPAGPYGTTLDTFFGTSPNGAWRLFVRDDAIGGFGAITRGWSLSFDLEPMTADLPAIVTSEDTPVTNLFTLTHPTFAPSGFRAVKDSEDPAVPGTISFANVAGPIYRMIFVPTPNGSGSSFLNISVTNVSGQVIFLGRIPVTVNPVNDAPSISSISPNLAMTLGSSLSLPVTISDLETPAASLVITLTSSNPSVIAPQDIIVLSSDNPNQKTLRLMARATGLSDVRITVADAGGQSVFRQFTVTVQQPQIPTFAATINAQIPPNATASPYPIQFNVAGFTNPVGRVIVVFQNLVHPTPDDLDIVLVGPQAQQSILMSDAGGNNPLSPGQLTIHDGIGDFAPPLPDEFPILPFASYRPSNYEGADILPVIGTTAAGDAPLSVFAGANPTGIWSLYIRNSSATASGSLGMVFLQIEPRQEPIILHPQSTVIPLGGTTTLSAIAAGPGPLNYRWLKNGTNIPGAVSPSLTLSNATLNTAGAFSFVVSNAYGVVTSMTAIVAIEVPAKGIYFHGTGHYYDYVPSPGISWDAASVGAVNRGAYLATATSALENRFLFEVLLDHRGGGEAWLGGIQPPNSAEPLGGWQWVTGEPWSFTSWAPSEPNNLGSAENHLTIGYFGDPTWNDSNNQFGAAGYLFEREGDLTGTGPVLTRVEADHRIIRPGRSVTLDVEFADSTVGDTYSARIEWGDGTFTVPVVDQSGKKFQAVHAYSAAGVYSPIVRVSDASLQTNSAPAASIHVVAGTVFAAQHGPNNTWNAYELVTIPMTFVEAKEFAETSSFNGTAGHLFVPRSRAEDNSIRRLTGRSYWIGLTDRPEFGGAETATGNPVLDGWHGWDGDPTSIPAHLQSSVRANGWVALDGLPYIFQAWKTGQPDGFNNVRGAAAREGPGWAVYPVGAFGEASAYHQVLIEYETGVSTPPAGASIVPSVLTTTDFPTLEPAIGVVAVREVRDYPPNITVREFMELVLAGQTFTSVEGYGPYVNFTDPETSGGGLFPGSRLPFLSNQPGINDDNFGTIYRGIIRVPVNHAGTWTFRISSDDGFILRVDNAHFSESSGLGFVDQSDSSVALHPEGAADSSTRIVANLSPGDYPFVLVHIEGSGGAYVELTAAPGRNLADAGTDQWLLVGEDSSPLQFVGPDTPLNTAPVAGNVAFAAQEDSTLNIAAPGVLSGSTDAENDPLQAMLVAGASHGVVTLNTSGAFTYVPAANFFGSDTFTFRVTDGAATSGVATATINVAAVSDAPVASNDNAPLAFEDTLLEVPAPGVLANDSDIDNTTLTARLTRGPSNGTVILNANGSYAYRPNPNYHGPDDFAYVAGDGTSESSPALVRITVAPVNDGPFAVNDVFDASEDTALSVPAPGVLANDTDLDGPALSAALVTGPANGTVVLNANGSFVYTPGNNFTGTDTFTYRANDGTASSAPATVTIHISDLNDVPLAVNDVYAGVEDETLEIPVTSGVLANDSDPENQSLEARLESGPSHGTLVLRANGSFTYQPAANFSGQDSFSYRAVDSLGATSLAAVSIAVSGRNDLPLAQSDGYILQEDATLVIAAPGLLANDSDIDGDALSASVASAPAHGTVAINPNGSFTYVPQANYHGPDSFTYVARDSVGASSPATVAIVIEPVNDAPSVAAVGTVSFDEDQPSQGISISVSDDGPAENLVFTASSSDSQLIPDSLIGFSGSGAARTLVLHGAPNLSGQAQIVVRVSDGSLNGETSFTATILPVNDAPEISEISNVATSDGAATGLVPFTVSDIDSPVEDLVVTAESGNTTLLPQSGISLGGTGSQRTVNLLPVAGQHGTATVTIRMEDAGGASASRSFQLSVVNEPLLIVSHPSSKNAAENSRVEFQVIARGQEPLRYQWFFNNNPLPAGTNALLVLANAQIGDSGTYGVEVSNAAGTRRSNDAILLVARAVSIDTQPSNRSVPPGSTVSFSVGASGAEPVTYQWFFGNNLIPGANAPTLVLSNVQPGAAGAYKVRVANAVSAVESTPASLSLIEGVRFVVQPQDLSVGLGQTLRLTAQAAGTPPIGYRWFFRNALLAGQTGETLEIASATTDHAGDYFVEATDAAGSILSRMARVSVISSPRIVGHPGEQTVPVGATALLTVVAEGTEPLSYEWFRNNQPLGVTGTPALRIAAVTSGDTGSYHVRVSNPAGSATSNPALLNVIDGVVVTSQPQDQTRPVGATVRFNVAAAGNALNYQWYFRGTLIPGAILPELVIPNAQLSADGSYSVEVRNGLGATRSRDAVLRMIAPPVIAVGPRSQQVVAGGVARFTVEASGGAPLNFRWTRNNVVIPGASGPILELPADQPLEGEYRVQVENLAGVVVSAPAMLTVLQPVEITGQPAPVTATAGQPASFSVRVTGSGPLEYQWMRDGFDIPGATLSSHLIASVSAADQGAYSVRVSNPAGGVFSAPAALTVNVPITFVEQPAPVIIKETETAQFRVVVEGSGPISYQWQLNNADIQGATSETLTINNSASANLGVYRVLVSNPAGSAMSAEARLSFRINPLIESEPQSITIDPGGTIVLNVVAEGPAPLTYSWSVNGVAIPGANSSSFVLPNAQPTNSGTYAVAVENAGGVAKSQPATVVVRAPFLAFADNRLVAPEVTVLNSVVSGNNLGATRETAEPNHAPGLQPEASVWMAWRPSVDGIATFTTAGSGFDTILAAYLVDTGGNLVPQATDEDSGPYLTSRIQFNSRAGSLYHIAIDGFRGTMGNVVLSWNTAVAEPRLPLITRQPGSFTALVGSAAEFSVVAQSTDGNPVNYQWLHLGQPISGANSSVLRLNSVRPDQAGRYSVRVVNTAHPSFVAESQPAYLQVNLIETQAEGPDVNWSDKLNVTTGPQTPQALPRRELRRLQAPARGFVGAAVFNTIGSAREAGEPSHCNAGGFASQWTVYEAADDGALLLTTDGSLFDTVLAVYDGNIEESFNTPLLACDNDGGADGKDSRLVIQVRKGRQYSIVVDGVNGASGLVQLNYTLARPPVLTRQPTASGGALGPLAVTQVPSGANVQLSVSATNLLADVQLLYQWSRNGAAIPNATNATLSLTRVNTSDAGAYTVTVRNFAGEVFSETLDLVVSAPVAIVTPPQNLTVPAGSSAIFSVVANGSGTLEYQWSRNGTPIPGATGPSLTVHNVQANVLGAYQVRVSNTENSVTAQAELALLPPLLILEQPAHAGAQAGGSATFRVLATGAGPLTYQWRFNEAAIEGATGSQLVVGQMTAQKAGAYSVLVSDGFATLASEPALLTFVVPVSITGQPRSLSIAGSSSARFEVVAAGSEPISYQWRFNGAPIQGATGRELLLENLRPEQAGSYEVVVSNAAGSLISIPATLSLLAPPTIQQQPVAQSVNAGAAAALNVAASGSGTLSYQWRRNGLAIPGATASTLAIPSVTAANEGVYTVAISNLVGAVISQPAALAVNIAPAITRAPASRTALAGSTVIFTVTATGTAPLAHQWFKNGIAIAAATNSFLAITNAQTSDGAIYRVRVSNTAGTVDSANAGLTVQTVPQIVDLRGSSTLRRGDTATFSVVAIGTRTLAYQWRFNGVNIPGATNTTLQITNVALNSAGDYSVTVNNDAGTVTSSALKLTVSDSAVVLAAGLQGNQLVITLSGPTGKQADVEVSTGLNSWSNIETVTFTNGQATSRQTVQPTGSRFFRTRIRD